MRIVHLCDQAHRNAMSAPLVQALHAALADVHDETHVVVLRGLPEVFCAGASQEVLRGLIDGRHAPTELTLPRAVLEVPVPVIAAMEGHAVGGGFALGLAADMALAARESRYGCNFMALGFTPGMGTTVLLEHALSRAVAHELLFTGAMMRGSELAAAGFHAVLPRDQVWPRALELAWRIAEQPRQALVLLKRTLSLPRRQALDQAFAFEALMHAQTFNAPGLAERIEDTYAT